MPCRTAWLHEEGTARPRCLNLLLGAEAGAAAAVAAAHT